jgi:hypothetical protein
LAFSFVDRGNIQKKHLRQATALLPHDEAIPVELRKYMTGEHRLSSGVVKANHTCDRSRDGSAKTALQHGAAAKLATHKL